MKIDGPMDSTNVDVNYGEHVPVEKYNEKKTIGNKKIVKTEARFLSDARAKNDDLN